MQINVDQNSKTVLHLNLWKNEIVWWFMNVYNGKCEKKKNHNARFFNYLSSIPVSEEAHQRCSQKQLFWKFRQKTSTVELSFICRWQAFICMETELLQQIFSWKILKKLFLLEIFLIYYFYHSFFIYVPFLSLYRLQFQVQRWKQ